MQTLFLDFDGPLFTGRGAFLKGNNGLSRCSNSALHPNMHYWVMDTIAVAFLNHLMDTKPFQTVVSSSWREIYDREDIEDLFVENELRLRMPEDWCTPVSKDQDRAKEIAEYITQHKIHDYIILDDIESGKQLSYSAAYGIEQSRVFLCSVYNGIDYSTMQSILKL